MWVVDTSIIISYLRSGKHQTFLFQNLSDKTLFLTGPVFCELLAGATRQEDIEDLEILRQALDKNIIETTLEDWILAGKCIADYSKSLGRIKPSSHILDVLIAIAAARIGATLATENIKDMKRWQEILITHEIRFDVAIPEA